MKNSSPSPPPSPPRSKLYEAFEEKASISTENSNNPSTQNEFLAKEDEDLWVEKNKNNNNKKEKKVFLEGYVEASDEDELSRTKSLTDDDLEELKGCLDLGFGFNYDEIPELCNTLPALELCYSMSQKYLDEQQQQQKSPDSMSDTASSTSSSPIPNWKISSPGDDPEDVKARLKFWAQAVACTSFIELVEALLNPLGDRRSGSEFPHSLPGDGFTKIYQ